MLEQLSRVLSDAHRRQRNAAVLCCGLDDFKTINEKFSYQVGDQALIAVAERLQAHSGRLSSVARLGGDQFALKIGRASCRERVYRAGLGATHEPKTPTRRSSS